MDDRKTLNGDALRRERFRQRASKQAAAHQTRIALVRYARIETGAIMPTKAEADRIVAVFGPSILEP